MRRILQVFYIFFSAIIVSVAIQNEFIIFGSPFLGLFGLIPLYLAIRNSNSYMESSLLTGLQVMLVHLMSSFWLGNFRDFAIFTLGASALGTGVIGMGFGILLHFPIATTRKEKTNIEDSPWVTVKRILMFAVIWTLYEWCKSNGFLAYPWGTILMTAYRWTLLIQIVSITGVWGLTFLFALFSAVVGEGIALIPLSHTEKDKNYFISYKCCGVFCIILFCISFCYGLFEYKKERIPIKKMETVIVQQNLDPWGSSDEEVIGISAKLTKEGIDECISVTGSKPDLIVWSEAVLSYTFPESINYYKKRPRAIPLIPFIQDMGVPFIIGAPVTLDKKNKQYGNAALYFDKEGNYKGYFAKMHLVPFAEIIPGIEYEWVRNLLKKVVGISGGWTSGKYLTMFDIPLKNADSVKISTPICFEDAFPAVCRPFYNLGSEVFVNITNDSWSLTKSAEYQHFVIASYRAIEYRTTMIRSTNSGYSVVVNPVGKVIADLPLFEEKSLYTSVPIYERTKTTYSIFGDWLPLICGIAFFWLCIKSFINQKKENQ